MNGVLVIGYGNPLRSDDGVGWHAAGRLLGDPRLDGAEVITCHQLTPELAADVAQASLVVLIDASVNRGGPGSVAVRRIQPQGDPPPLTWSHQMDPAALAGLASALYRATPPMVMVSVVGASLAPGDRLSPTLQRVLPGVVETVAEVVKEHRHA
jgi:hydrogenase maturation protease